MIDCYHLFKTGFGMKGLQIPLGTVNHAKTVAVVDAVAPIEEIAVKHTRELFYRKEYRSLKEFFGRNVI
jgi:hypothetical protein